MPPASAFKSGRDQAVRIRDSLKDAVALLLNLPKPTEIETREAIEMPGRDL